MPDTIAAISTGAAATAIGIIRLSGENAIQAVDRVFRAFGGGKMADAPSRSLVYGEAADLDGAVLDHCLCTVSRAPNSYTGEDTAELQCHGSPVVLRSILEALFRAGVRQALPGEFTKRAFLNGRMDLVQAEAVIDLINAETQQAARNAAGQLGGAVARRTDGIYDSLAAISAHYHAVLDYPDEDIEPFELEQYAETLKNAETELSRLEASFSRGMLLQSGIPTAILGKPNAGKSTLLNAILGYERAIVTDIPGTTRDTISERAVLGGRLLRLIDTAGIRETADEIERLGVERSRLAAKEAQLAIVLIDGSSEPDADDLAALAAAGGAKVILVRSKSDLPEAVWEQSLPADERVTLSGLTGDGLDELAAAIARLFPPESGEQQGEILTSARQTDAVGRALGGVRAAREAMLLGVTPDIVLTETERAMSALGELTGRTVREDITNEIFSRFCVGK